MPLGAFVVIAVLAWPFLEIAAFVAVGREIGIAATLALVIATSVLGAVLLRIQGLATLMRVRREIGGGALPLRSIGHAALIGVGGLLLFLPGFVSDVFGILLFLPPVRSLILSALARRSTVVVSRGFRRARPGVVDLEAGEWRAGGDAAPGPHAPRLPGPGEPPQRAP